MPTLTHPSRAHQVPASHPKRKRKQKPTHITGRPHPKAHKVNPTKRRIRDIERLLARKERPLPADKRIEKERELAGLKEELRNETKEIKRAEMIGRYHMVRFFDSKKAERALKKARRAVGEAGEEDMDEAEERVRRCEVDYNYTRFYPFMKAYHSLYPPKRKAEEDDHGADERMDVDGAESEVTARGDREIWTQVEQAMADGTLEALRDGVEEEEQKGKAEAPTRRDGKSKKGSKHAAAGVRHKKDVQKEEGGEDSDGSGGGFFE